MDWLLAKHSGAVVAAACLGATLFVVFGGQTPLWYDEANYLNLAQSIRADGYPFVFYLPEQRSFFLDSPPGLTYLLSVLLGVTSEPWALRLLYCIAFVPLPFVVLWLHLRRGPDAAATLALCVLFSLASGYFIIEFLQMRMDLPLASASFVVLTLVAWTRDAAGWRRLGLYAAIALVSAVAVLIKFQAVCLTAVVVVFALVERQRGSSWSRTAAPALAHLAGFAAGLLVLAVLFVASDTSLASLGESLSYNIGRVLPLSADRGRGLLAAAVAVAQKAAVATVALSLAAAVARLRPSSDPLLILCILFSVVVSAFSLVTFRMPGAGTYYMVQAAIPLGYIFARSLLALLSSGARGRVAAVALAVLLGVQGVLTLPLGDKSDQRWNAGLYGLSLGKPDEARAVAARILASLRGNQQLLLDGWEFQAFELPFWAGLHDRYGYLFEMTPADALELVGREGPAAVGVIALTAGGRERLRSGEWSDVAAAIEQHFDPSPDASDGRWLVLVRR